MASNFARDAHSLPEEPGAMNKAGTTAKTIKENRATFRASVGHGTGFSGAKGQGAGPSEGEGTSGDPMIRYVNALTWARPLPRTGKFSTVDQMGKNPVNYYYDPTDFLQEY